MLDGLASALQMAIFTPVGGVMSQRLDSITELIQGWSPLLQTSMATPQAVVSPAPGYDITPVLVSVTVGISATVGIALFSRWIRNRQSQSDDLES